MAGWRGVAVEAVYLSENGRAKPTPLRCGELSVSSFELRFELRDHCQDLRANYLGKKGSKMGNQRNGADISFEDPVRHAANMHRSELRIQDEDAEKIAEGIV